MITPHIPKLLQACQNLSSYSAISSKLKKTFVKIYSYLSILYFNEHFFIDTYEC